MSQGPAQLPDLVVVGSGLFGLTIAERCAEELGLKVLVDLVPNHYSSEHEWFRAAVASPPGSAERGRYIFREGRGPGGEEPPNNWPSVFGGPAWTRVPDGQWYLHIFAPEQPDLDFANPEVVADLEETMRFWLDRGVDGFRIDVAHGMAKPEGLPDMVPMDDTGLLDDHGPGDHRFDQDGDIRRIARARREEHVGAGLRVGPQTPHRLEERSRMAGEIALRPACQQDIRARIVDRPPRGAQALYRQRQIVERGRGQA